MYDDLFNMIDSHKHEDNLLCNCDGGGGGGGGSSSATHGWSHARSSTVSHRAPSARGLTESEYNDMASNPNATPSYGDGGDSYTGGVGEAYGSWDGR